MDHGPYPSHTAYILILSIYHFSALNARHTAEQDVRQQPTQSNYTAGRHQHTSLLDQDLADAI